MSVSLVLAIFLALSLILLGIAMCCNLDQRSTITGLRDQLHAESEAAAYWYDAAHGLTWTTRDGGRIGFHQTHGEHLAAALDRAEWPGGAR